MKRQVTRCGANFVCPSSGLFVCFFLDFLQHLLLFSTQSEKIHSFFFFEKCKWSRIESNHWDDDDVFRYAPNNCYNFQKKKKIVYRSIDFISPPIYRFCLLFRSLIFYSSEFRFFLLDSNWIWLSIVGNFLIAFQSNVEVMNSFPILSKYSSRLMLFDIYWFQILHNISFPNQTNLRLLFLYFWWLLLSTWF